MFKALFFVAVAVFGLCTGAPLEEDESKWDWRIVGGQNAPNGAYPYQVALRTTTNSFFCGGFIIGKRTVGTAAHCVTGRAPSSYVALAGTNTLNAGGVTLRPNRQLIHPEWNNQVRRNDIALVFFGEDIAFTSAIQPIALEANEIGAGVTLVLTGWGRLAGGGSLPNDLQVITLLSLANTDCQTRVGSLGTIHDSIICTLTRQGEGACNGDSGGALTAQGKAVGVVNWGSPCARGIPDMYARISSFVPWIEQNIED